MRPFAVIDEIVWPRATRPRTACARKTFTENICSLLIIFTVLSAHAPRAVAQRTAGGRASAAGHSAISHSPAGHSRSRRSAHPSSSRRSSPYASSFGSLPFPFFGDSFDPNDIYSTGYPVASDPPPFLMQAMQQLAGSGPASLGQAINAQAMNAPANHQPSSTDPLMIELHNGQYVRVNSVAANGEAEPLKLPPNHSQASSASPPMITASPSQPLPPAVLIFRDGHSEEVRDYTIADGILYARGDYYTDGYWNKKINLATLNVPETLQANAARSVNFVLPSSPNEVITRP
jgi:hypothetical protein